MNWTEGALARHSRRKGWDKDAARQKEYFAKARAKKHETIKKKSLNPSAFIPGYMPQPKSPNSHSPGSSGTARERPNRSRKRLMHLPQKPGEKQSAAADWGMGSRPERSSTETFDEPYSSPRHETLDAKRRRLLEKADWIGVNLQKPIVVDFSWHRNHVLKQSLPRGGVKSARRSHRAEIFDRERRIHGIHDAEDERRENDNAVRLRIGSQSLRWSRASNSIRSPTSQYSRIPTFEAWKSQQDRFSSSRASSHSSSRSSYLHRVTQRHGCPSDDASSSVLEARVSVVGGRCTLPNSSLPELPHKRRKLSDDPEIIVRSSPSIIHHPQPTRGTRLALFDIRSPDSHAASSTLAQIGIPDLTTTSKSKDDQKWNTWLHSTALADGLQDEDALHEGGESQQSISPGASHYWRSNPTDRSLSTLDSAHEAIREQPPPQCRSPVIVISSSPESSTDTSDDEVLDVISNQPTLDPADPDIAKSNEGRKSTQRQDEPLEKIQNNTKLPDELILPSAPQLPKAPNVQDLMDLLIDEENLENENTLVHDREKEGELEDEDEIWRKFIFDGNVSDINRRALEEAHKQATEDLCQAIADTASNMAEPPSTIREQASMSPEPSYSPAPGSPSVLPQEELLISSQAPSSEATGSVIAPGASSPHAEFKFHHPRLFVGRLAGRCSTDVNFISPPPQPRKRGRGRTRNRRIDGRPDFRAMPDFDGDPIEES